MTQSSPPRSTDKETLRSVKENLEICEKVGEQMSISAEALSPVKRMNRSETKGNIASKLKKTGATLIALPDPATSAIGVPMLAAGFALEKVGNRELTLPQMTNELAKTVKELEKLRRANLR